MSSAHGHHPQDSPEVKEYTLEDIHTHALSDPRFHRNLRKLPRVHTVPCDVSRSTLLKASLPQRIRVGHVHILCGLGAEQSRCIQAYVNSDTNSVGIEDIYFCLTNDTVISRKAVLQADLKYPFDYFKSSKLDDEVTCRRLRTLVLYYFLAKGFVQRIGLTDRHLCSFKKACATVVESKVFKASSYEVEPISGVELLRAQNRFLDVTNDEPTEVDADSQTEQGDEHTSKLNPNGKRESH